MQQNWYNINNFIWILQHATFYEYEHSLAVSERKGDSVYFYDGDIGTSTHSIIIDVKKHDQLPKNIFEWKDFLYAETCDFAPKGADGFPYELRSIYEHETNFVINLLYSGD